MGALSAVELQMIGNAPGLQGVDHSAMMHTLDPVVMLDFQINRHIIRESYTFMASLLNF